MAKWIYSTVRFSVRLLFCLPLLTCQQVEISQSQVVRLDETLKVTCTTNDNTPIQSCNWRINTNPINVAEKSPYQPLNDLKDGRCGVQMDQITEDENGEWECMVFPYYNISNPATKNGFKAKTNVTVVALPNVSIITDGRQDSRLINVIADGKANEIHCLIINARPVPAIRWKLGDELITSNHHQETLVKDENIYGKVNVTSTLKYIFLPEHYEKLLSCEITGQWLKKEDPRKSSATLNVMFFPEPKNEIILYGFVLGQPGDIKINLAAHPSPSTVLWKIENGIYFDIQSFSNSTLINKTDNYQIFEINELNTTLHEVHLNIDPVKEEDLHRQYRLVLKWENLNVTREIPVNISTMRSKNNQAMSDDETIVIVLVIVVLLLFILAALVLYARKTGRLCFAGSRSTSNNERKEFEFGNRQESKEHEGDIIYAELDLKPPEKNGTVSTYQTTSAQAANDQTAIYAQIQKVKRIPSTHQN